MAPIILEPSPKGIQNLPNEHPEYNLFRRIWENWFSSDPLLPFTTSGSSGAPKEYHFNRNQVRTSAQLTASWLQAGPPLNWLLCLPISFVAGRMVLYRALISNTPLQVLIPKAQPIEGPLLSNAVSLTPAMLAEALKSQTAANALSKFQHILLGGGQLNRQLEMAIESWSPILPQIWHTYGMTETLTHVGARQVYPKKEIRFKPIDPSIQWNLNAQGLEIFHPKLQKEPIQTTDAGEINTDGAFLWTGRMDFLLKVGGKKVWPEVLERKLIHEYHGRLPNFYFSGTPHDTLGQSLVLVFQEEPQEWDNLIAYIRKWHGSERPIHYCIRPQDFDTSKDKIKRQKTLAKEDLNPWPAR